MTWFTDAQIATDSPVDGPVKSQTINRVQQNISAAFAGDSGSPSLASGVAGAAYGSLPLDSVGMHRTIIQTNATNSISYTPGTTYSAASIGLASGTWMHLGGGVSGTQQADDGVGGIFTDLYYFTNTFVRVA